MLVKCTDSLYNLMDFTDEQNTKLGIIFRTIAGKRLSTCKDFYGILSNWGIIVRGDNEALSRELYLNSVLLLMADEGEVLYLSDSRAKVYAEKEGISCELVTLDEMCEIAMTQMGILNDYEDDDEDEDYSEEYTSDEDSEYYDDSSEEGGEDTYKEVPKETDNDRKDNGKLSKEVRDSIKGYYYQLYSGILSELSKRYTSLFESGYEVVKPAGILSSNGLLSLSGSSVVVKNNIALRNIYNIFYSRIGFSVCLDRSNLRIADIIYSNYYSGRKLIYFPHKLLEFAYGRKAPDGDEQNSENTFKKHSEASNWSAYCKSEVKKSLMGVLEANVVRFVSSIADSKGVDYFDDSIAGALKDYLGYLQSCLSLCLLMVEYKGKTRGYVENVYSFKVRVCDPKNNLGNVDLTSVIINEAFMGSTGEVPFSYKPRFEDATFIKEYAHEFNHNSSQASPLFAYKAYQALQAQGVEPTWNNMVLGMFEDGTILKNGKHGVSLESRLTHHLVAGSRAGKGVMTLNVLASGIYSNKNIFYLDRKPDMASLFKSISPSMFVVNGGGYGEQYDTFKQFNNMDSLVNWSNVPDYICNILDCAKRWDSLGDLFYMRALKLILGIIVARGDGRLDDPAFGGRDGILLVVDEFKNFQESFHVIVEKLISWIPPCSYSMDVVKLENGKVEESKFNKSYNDGSFYALTYMNSLVSDLEFLSTRRDAGFNQAELSYSDIFVIGQHLGYGDLDFRKIRSAVADSTSSERYKSCGYTGLKGQVLGVTESFPFSMVGFKTCDAFFGRNMEDGRSVYLAQTNHGSKAYGRLDDKASNFAYMGTFTEDVRKDIVGGNVGKNVAIANSCTYFKPFLVLNDSIPGGNCVEGMFSRCAGPNLAEPWVTREELIADNPNEDGTYINKAVGFEDYLLMMGLSDYKQRLAKSGDIADYVVKKCLGYPGTWFEFITDLRPEWCFTIKDVVDGAKGICPALLNIRKNPIVSEFVEFNPSALGLGDSELDYDNDNYTGSTSDYMDYEDNISDDQRDYEMKKIFGDKDIQGDDYSKSEEDGYRTSGEVNTEVIDRDLLDEEIDIYGESSSGGAGNIGDVDGSSAFSSGEVSDLINRLRELGVNVKIGEPKTRSEKAFHGSSDFGKYDFKNTVGGSDETEFDEDIQFDGSVNSKADLIRLISKDIINRFGGLDSIRSFRVMSGGIIVNEYRYGCNASDIFVRSLPYDLKKDIRSGNISKLFDYSLIRGMSRLRDLEFDSPDLVYNYVSYGMGYGNRVSVDLFFNDLPSLQRLAIGNKLYNRKSYKEDLEEGDPLYNPRLSTRLADYSEEVLGRFSKNSWEFTKNTMRSNDYRGVMKFLGVTSGVVATGVTGGGRLAVKGGRKLIHGLGTLGRSIKTVLDETKKY